MSHELVAAMVEAARGAGGGSWLRANCLACPERAGKQDTKRSFSWNATTGRYRCLRCGLWGAYGGNGRHVTGHTRDDSAAPEDEAERECQHLPAGFYLLEEEPARSSLAAQPARLFMDRRGIGPDKRAALGIGACLVPGGSRGLSGRDYYGRIVAPLWAPDGSLYGYVARSWEKRHPVPYLYPKGMEREGLLFGAEQVHLKTDEPLLVVEGYFDAAYLGPGAVPMFGFPGPAQLAILAEAERPLGFLLDGDAWRRGWALAQQVRAAQASQRRRPTAFAMRLGPGKDPDDYPAAELWAAARELAREEA